MARPTPDSEGLQPIAHAPEYAPQVVRDSVPPEVDHTAMNGYYESPRAGSETDSDFHKVKVDPPWRETAVGTEAIQQPQPSRWRRHRKTIVAAALALVLAVVLAIAIPVALLTRRNTAVDSATSQPLNANRPSTSGAFAGTGLGTVATEPSYVYYQRYDGSLWQKTVSGVSFDGSIWQGNARNGTPISAQNYNLGADAIVHVIYVDQNNVLQDIREVNSSGQWSPGNLGGANIKVSESLSAGLGIVPQYGQVKTNSPKILASIKVYYGGQDGRIHEVSQNVNSTSWNETFVFPDNINGHAGFEAIQPAGANIKNSYLHCSDVNNVLSWFSQETYPKVVGEWTQGAASSIILLPNSTISLIFGADMVLYQDPSSNVNQVTFSSNHSDPFGQIIPVGPGYPRTRMVSRYEGPHPTAWFQTTGDNMVMYQEFSGNWNMSMEQLG